MLLALLGLIIGCYKAWDREDLFLTFAGGAIGVLFGLLFAAMIGMAVPSHAQLMDSTPLVSLRDQAGPSGAFFLGSGQIGEDSYYFYYESCGGGCYNFQKTVADDSVKVYEDSNSPHVDTYLDIPNGAWILVGIPFGPVNTEFHIPRGTLKQTFSLN